MHLVCNACFNYSYFTTSVELVREIKIDNGNIVIEDSLCQDFNFSATAFRHLLQDIINYVKRVDFDAMDYNEDSHCFENKYISCSECEGKMVTVPQRKIKIVKPESLGEEIIENRKELLNLRRRKNGHLLPILQKHK
ncbi:MAG: hypothetical protein H8E60_11085 [Candidatus Marinimicrobia bacterium]|nr:hypothetical protein [Candidatus Neomarinimicrobiota bacterium]